MPTSQSDTSAETRTKTSEYQFAVNGRNLKFWLEVMPNGDTVLFARREPSERPKEKYAVATVTHDGDFFRNRGLPSGWGFQLTEGRRIKEIA